MHRAIASLSALVALGAASACSPVKEAHGWIPDSASEVAVQPGVDTKSTVLARLGTPSTTGMFDQTSWYYVSSTQERFAFYQPKTSAREVTVVRFGADDMVSAVEKFGLEKGRVIAFNDDKTPTRGRELGLIEQLFGNIGAGSPVGVTDPEAGRNRR